MKTKVKFFLGIALIFLFVVGCGNSKKEEQNGDDDKNGKADSNVEDETNDNDGDEIFEDVVLNPSGNIPLSAGVSISSDKVAKVIVFVKDIDGVTRDFEKEYLVGEESKEVMIPVLGLFPDFENRVVLKAFDKEEKVIAEKEFKIKTDKLPKNFPEVELDGKIESGWTILNWLFTPRERPEMAFIAVDQSGRIRWYSDFPYPAAFPLTLHGDYIYTSDGENTLYKYDFMGFELGKWGVEQHGFTKIHHEIVIKDDGNIILGVSKIDSPWIEDWMIEINPATNQLRATWDLNKTFPDVCDLFHDVPLSAGGDPTGQANDPVHQNSAWYNSEDNSIIVGSQRSGIAKMTHSGYLKWFLTPHIVALIDDENRDGRSDSLLDGYDENDLETKVGDFKGDKYVYDRMPIAGKPFEAYSDFDFRYQEFLLTPLDKKGKEITDLEVLNGFIDHEDFAWPFRPHSPTILKNGNLMIFDNGLARNFKYPPVFPDFYSRAVEYEIVPDKDGYGGTIKQVWEHILENDPMWYSMAIVVSNASELENGNRLIAAGSLGTSFIPDLLRPLYGEGPIGALIVEVNPADNTELNAMRFKRYIDDDYPNPQFSAYRAYRFEL
ncbi:MAG: aryl-sulfate sulfotransferase [bacterium]